MHGQGRSVKESFATRTALVRALSCVGHQMSAEAAPVTEGLPTLRTVVGLLSSVSSLVADEGRMVKEGLPAVTTFLVLLFREGFLGWGCPALQAFVQGKGFLASLCFKTFLCWF